MLSARVGANSGMIWLSACAAASASLDLLQKEECRENIKYISENNREFVQQLKENK
jgi:adenosylmethionine-8-amino-7-oxononanoate aminotransferase